MKKLLLIIIFLFSYDSYSEYKWTEILPHIHFGEYYGSAEDSSGNFFIYSPGAGVITPDPVDTMQTIVKSTDDGMTWKRIFNTNDRYVIQIEYNKINNYLYYSDYFLHYSSDGGRNFIDISPKSINFNDPSIVSSGNFVFKNDTLITNLNHYPDKTDYQEFVYTTDNGKKWLMSPYTEYLKDRKLEIYRITKDIDGIIYFIADSGNGQKMFIYKLDYVNAEPKLMTDIGGLGWYDMPEFIKGDNGKLFYNNVVDLWLLNKSKQTWEKYPLSLSTVFKLRYNNGIYFLLNGDYLYVSNDYLKTFEPIHKTFDMEGIKPDFFVTKKGTIILNIMDNYRGTLVTDVKEQQEEKTQTYNFSSFSSFSNFLILNTNNDYYKQVEIYNLQGRLLYKSGDILNIGVHIPEINYEKVLFYRFTCNGKGYTGKILNLR